MDEEKILEKVIPIEGWLNETEIIEIFKQAQITKGTILEIGSWKGRSTSALLLGNYYGNKNKIIAIDTFKCSAEHKPSETKTLLEELKENVYSTGLPKEYVDNTLEIKEGRSRIKIPEVQDNSISLAFIDASHLILNVIEDFALTLPKLKPNAIVIFHDATTWYGPEEFCKMLSKFFIDTRISGTMHLFEMEKYKGFNIRSKNIKGLI